MYIIYILQAIGLLFGILYYAMLIYTTCKQKVITDKIIMYAWYYWRDKTINKSKQCLYNVRIYTQKWIKPNEEFTIINQPETVVLQMKTLKVQPSIDSDYIILNNPDDDWVYINYNQLMTKEEKKK